MLLQEPEGHIYILREYKGHSIKEQRETITRTIVALDLKGSFSRGSRGV